jgi:hypothetical protein
VNVVEKPPCSVGRHQCSGLQMTVDVSTASLCPCKTAGDELLYLWTAALFGSHVLKIKWCPHGLLLTRVSTEVTFWHSAEYGSDFRHNSGEITSEVKKFRGIPCRRNSVDTLLLTLPPHRVPEGGGRGWQRAAATTFAGPGKFHDGARWRYCLVDKGYMGKCCDQSRYDMNGRFQMPGGKNWILPKEMNTNWFFWESHWPEIWSKHLRPSMGPNGGSVAMDSEVCDPSRVGIRVPPGSA